MSTRLVQAEPEDSVRAASGRMVAAGVGSVAVCDGARLVGILTERDVLGLVAAGTDLDAALVGETMTAGVVTVSADDDILAAARLMGERHVRHLPVVQGENLLGIVGIRDVLGALVRRSDDEAVHETLGLLARRS
jgi:CBS domain-containing protein